MKFNSLVKQINEPDIAITIRATVADTYHEYYQDSYRSPNPHELFKKIREAVSELKHETNTQRLNGGINIYRNFLELSTSMPEVTITITGIVNGNFSEHYINTLSYPNYGDLFKEIEKGIDNLETKAELNNLLEEVK